jgi:hypothetical protein
LVLIDITGVSVVDSRTAIGLLRISKTIRLLGSRTTLTEISSSVANMLVELDLDLHGIETYAAIQAALNDYRAISSEQSLAPYIISCRRACMRGFFLEGRRPSKPPAMHTIQAEFILEE